MKEISAEITCIQERITDADQAIEDSESRIEEERQEYINLSLEAEENDPEQVEEKRLEIRPEMEKKIVRNIEKRTGKKIRELDLAISTTETDKLLCSLVHNRKQKLKDKEIEETKRLSDDPAKAKKEKAVEGQQKQV